MERMDVVKSTKWKKNLFLKAWNRSLSAGSEKSSNSTCNSFTKSKSWHSTTKSGADQEDSNTTEGRRKNRRNQVAPHGCFAVYVGPERQRFAVKAEFANHHLFQMLLEDAELEYGHNTDGPIMLPCDVNLFHKVLAEMEREDDDEMMMNSPSCSSLSLCSPVRSFNTTKKGGHGAYRILHPSRILKLNNL